MDKETLYENLFQWIQIFDVAKDIANIEDISDGIVISKILNTIAPDYFTDTWLMKIKGDCKDNWRLKLSNLKKIMKSILDYNTDILDVHFSEFQMPDMNSIAEYQSKEEMGRFLQLVLGCAVNCPHKERYIQAIMSLEEHVQHTVMQAIQELMSTDTRSDALTELEEKLRKTIEDYNAALESKEEIAQRCHELDMQMSLLMMEKSQLQTENEILLKRLGDIDTHQRIFEHLNNKGDDDDHNLSAKDVSQESLHKMKQLQDQIDNLQEELFRVDTSREEFKLKLESTEKENAELKIKIDSMWVGAEELRQLKDELDIMRERAAQVGRYESAIEQYKKRVDDSSDLRREKKELEEKNIALDQKISEYKEEMRKISTLRTQLDLYKREVAEVRTKYSEETKRADTLEFELKRIQEKYENSLLEMKHLMSERDSLREKMEEFELIQCNQGSPHSHASSLADETGERLPLHVSERIVSLEKEVSTLKGRLEAQKLEENMTAETLLEDSKLRVSQLEAENRLSHQRILELSARVEDLENELLEKGASSDSSLKSPVKMNDDQNRAIIAEKEVLRLTQKLALVENDFKKMEQKYKKYLEKARNIVRQLASTNFSDSSGAAQIPMSQELQSLKHNLLGKEKQLEQLEKQHEREMGVREDEERLMVAAWYNLGVRLNREAAEERLSNNYSSSTPTQQTPNSARPGGAGQSFLARQRQVHAQKSYLDASSPTLPNSGQQNNAVHK